MLALWKGGTYQAPVPPVHTGAGKQRRPAVAAHTAGPARAEAYQQATDEWTEPRRSARTRTAPPAVPTPVSNRFGMLRDEALPEMDEAGEEQDPEPGPPQPRRKKRARERKKQEVQPEGEPEVKLLERPHKSTWFLPGKVGRVPVQILMDTGCTTNLMSKTIFDKLDKATKETIEPCEAFGTLADGGKLIFHGLVKT